MAKLTGKAKDRARQKQKNRDKNSRFLRKKNLLSKILKWDDPILKETCDTVDPTEDISEIIKEMKSILMVSINGLGIAASQIGYTKRIFITRPMTTSTIDEVKVFINSSIALEGEEKEKRGEGCLSVGSHVAVIERPSEVTIGYQDENFKDHTKKFKGLEAKVIFHEHDHNFGICLVGDDYEKSLKKKDEIVKDII